MGAGQSMNIKGATDAQLSRVGQFELREDEKAVVKALYEDVLGRLLMENNLFDLSLVLGQEDRCKSLFYVLKYELEKDFMILKFPDPRRSSEIRSTFIIKKGDYEKLDETTFGKKTLCDEIIYFMIRLVTLVAALSASVHTGTDLNVLKSAAGTQIPAVATSTIVGTSGAPLTTTTTTTIMGTREDIKSPLTTYFDQFVGRSGIRPDILRSFEEEPYAEDKLNKLDWRNIYCFGKETSVVIDARRSLVYRTQTDNSRTYIVGIQLERVQLPKSGQAGLLETLAARTMIPQAPAAPSVPVLPPTQMQPVQGALPAAAPAPAQPQMPFATPPPRQNYYGPALARQPVNPFNSLSALSRVSNPTGIALGEGRGRRSRRSRNGSGRRLTRRGGRVAAVMYGGGETSYFMVTLLKVGADCRNDESCELESFYMDTRGHTYSMEEWRRFESNPTGPLTTGPSFAQKVKTLFDSIKSKESVKLKEYELEKPKRGEEPAKIHEYAKEIYKLDKSAYNNLREIQRLIKETPEGTSPATYRAYLLATSKTAEGITTMICNNKWDDKRRVSSVVAYSLLQALYSQVGEKQMLANEEIRGVVKEFQGAGVATAYVGMTGGETNFFDNISFAGLPKQLQSFCAAGPSLEASPYLDKAVTSPAYVKILTEAHRKLRALFDAHINNVVTLLRKALVIKRDGASIRLLLNDNIIKGEYGSRYALEEVIAEARKMLSNHYFEVEKVYKGALDGMSQVIQGISKNTGSPISNTQRAQNVLATPLPK